MQSHLQMMQVPRQQMDIFLAVKCRYAPSHSRSFVLLDFVVLSYYIMAGRYGQKFISLYFWPIRDIRYISRYFRFCICILTYCPILYNKTIHIKAVVLNLFSTGPHYGPSASLTGRTHVIYILRHQYKPTRFIILFIA